jgi:hypothetical protein
MNRIRRRSISTGASPQTLQVGGSHHQTQRPLGAAAAGLLLGELRHHEIVFTSPDHPIFLSVTLCYFASGAGAPFSATSPLTVLGSTISSFSLASAEGNFCGALTQGSATQLHPGLSSSVPPALEVFVFTSPITRFSCPLLRIAYAEGNFVIMIS